MAAFGSPFSNDDDYFFAGEPSNGGDDFVFCRGPFDPKSPFSEASSFSVVTPQSHQESPSTRAISIPGTDLDGGNTFGGESVSSSPESTQASENGIVFEQSSQGSANDYSTQPYMQGNLFPNLSDGHVAHENPDFMGLPIDQGHVPSPLVDMYSLYNLGRFTHLPNQALRMTDAFPHIFTSTGFVPSQPPPWNTSHLRSPGNDRPSNVLWADPMYPPNSWSEVAHLQTLAGVGAMQSMPNVQDLPEFSDGQQTPFQRPSAMRFQETQEMGVELPHGSDDFTSQAGGSVDTNIKEESQSPSPPVRGYPASRNDNNAFTNLIIIDDSPDASRSGRRGSPGKFEFAQSLSKDNFPEKTAAESASHKAGKGALQKHTGRQVGSHLAPEIKQHASEMRNTTACWRCRIQRDKCSPGKICDRCRKANQSPDSGLGCCRAKIINFAETFVPVLMVQVHNKEALERMANTHIKRFYSKQIDLALTCGRGMPPMRVPVYEFEVKTPELLQQYQFINDPKKGEVQRQIKLSPPVGMVLELPKDGINRCKRYVELIAQDNTRLHAFAKCCYEEEGNLFLRDIFLLMFKFQPQTEEERKVQLEAYQLIVITYIMTHTLTIPDDELDSLRSLETFQDGKFPRDCSPRLANKQLKHFFAQLHRMRMRSLLNHLQQILKSSKWTERWATAFIAVVALALSLEEIQFTTHLTMDALVRIKKLNEAEAEQRACLACKEIDADFNIVREIFKTKYTRMYNPLRDPQSTWASKISCAQTVKFVGDAQALFKEHVNVMYYRSQIEIGGTNKARYPGRLVSKFVHMLYVPWKS